MDKNHEQTGCAEYRKVSRRRFIGGASAAGIATILGYPWLPRVAFSQCAQGNRDVIVSVYLRGGADGLTLCVPYAEANYYALRPSLSIPPPGSGKSGAATDLDGFFGFSRSFDPLVQPFRDGKLAVVHAVGQDNWTRSHFDAQRWMEAADRDQATITGWLGRHLATSAPVDPNAPLRGASMTHGMALTMNGGPRALPVPDPAKFGYDRNLSNIGAVAGMLSQAYSGMHDLTNVALQNTQQTINTLATIDFAHYKPSGGAVYTSGNGDTFGPAMKASAALLKAGVGVEAVHIDYDGWDTHANQGSIGGLLDSMMRTLASNLSAFYTDMFTDGRTGWTLVVVSEFGRNVAENGSSGTDHGAGNCMLVMGGSVNGRTVYRNWPGLAKDQLFEGQDLRPTIDYRDVLSEIVSKRLQNQNLGQVFPNYTPTFRGVVS